MSVLTVGLFLIAAPPAFADQLTAAEVYRVFEGDWAVAPGSGPEGQHCQSGVRRLTLDADGFGLAVQDVAPDGSMEREFRYRLPSLPSAEYGGKFVAFLGPEVDQSTDGRELFSISMTDADHMLVTVGYLPKISENDILDPVVPHGDGARMVRCP